MTESCKPYRSDWSKLVEYRGQFQEQLLTSVQLNNAMEIATDAQNDRAGNAIQAADAEIARFRAILQQIDELENEFEKIKRIREIVRSFKSRVEEMERRLG